jgi:uncharacterized protein YcfJ
MKKSIMTMFTVLAVGCSPALADNVQGTVTDHYKTVIQQTPYSVEICKDVQVPRQGQGNFDKEGAIIGGIIGGLLGNQVGKGSGKEAATGVGALTGAIIGGNKKGPTTYETKRQCSFETRYEEVKKEVYSHSIMTFWYGGKNHRIRFNK